MHPRRHAFPLTRESQWLTHQCCLGSSESSLSCLRCSLHAHLLINHFKSTYCFFLSANSTLGGSGDSRAPGLQQLDLKTSQVAVSSSGFWPQPPCVWSAMHFWLGLWAEAAQAESCLYRLQWVHQFLCRQGTFLGRLAPGDLRRRSVGSDGSQACRSRLSIRSSL